MIRKRFCILALCAAGILLLGGCKETPDSVIVKQKGEKAMDNYQEDESLADGKSKEGEDYSSILRERLGAPDRYENSFTSEDGKVVVNTDAPVEIPNTPQISTLKVTAEPMTEEWFQRMTEGLFPDGTIYDEDAYITLTKSEVEAKITELKGYIAQGNLDPFDYGTDEFGNPYFDINEVLESYEELYNESPETVDKREISPEFSEDEFGDWFRGVVETEDGGVFTYYVGKNDWQSMYVTVKQRRSEDSKYHEIMWREYGLDYTMTTSDNSIQQSNDWKPSEEEMKESIGISWEEAKRMADEKVSAMGITDMEVEQWDYSMLMAGDEGSIELKEMVNSGYWFYYSRRVENCPVTYTMEQGGGLEDMDSTVEPWNYERLNIIISKDGVEEIDFDCPYQVTETQVENVKLLDFQEVTKIYEQMMEYKFSSMMDDPSMMKYKVDVDRITLGYMRIYNPSENNRSGVLVPVWDFFGGSENERKDGDVIFNDSSYFPCESKITINAIDGTVIDRSLGY